MFPFYWRTKTAFDSGNYPTKYIDFDLYIDHECGYFIQRRTKKLTDIIKETYKLDYNIGYLQEGVAEFETYGGEFLNIIQDKISLLDSDNTSLKIVDIGCGSGAILKRIATKRPESILYGIDPAPIAKRGVEKYNFKLISDFYPPKNRNQIKDADVIIHYDVLEHVDNPLQFLRENYIDLNNGGILIFSVPDCTTSIMNGDISMLIHEHLNYFDQESIHTLTEKAGFSDVDVFKGVNGGTLFCSAVKKNDGLKTPDMQMKKVYEDYVTKFKRFVEKYNILMSKLRVEIDMRKGSSIGFYVPIRSIPYLTNLNINNNYRFFDDSIFFRDRYLDGYDDIRIECIDDFKRYPVDTMFVMTYVFGEVIRKKIKEINKDTEVILIESLF